jgi:Spy/CpxP family protein refolding chaperone
VRPWKAILAALVIFLAGAASGGLAARLYLGEHYRPAPRASAGGPPVPWTAQRGEFLRRIGSQLDLTADQRQRIDRMINESQQRMKGLWEPVAPLAQEEMRQLRRNIAAELTSSQRERFDKLLEKRGPRRPGELTNQHRREGRWEGPPQRFTPPPGAPRLEPTSAPAATVPPATPPPPQ